jgi:hypothetical protein
MCVEKKGNCGPARGNMIHALQKSLERGGAELSPQGFEQGGEERPRTEPAPAPTLSWKYT